MRRSAVLAVVGVGFRVAVGVGFCARRGESERGVAEAARGRPWPAGGASGLVWFPTIVSSSTSRRCIQSYRDRTQAGFASRGP